MCVHLCDKVSIRIYMQNVALWTDQRTVGHTGTPPKMSAQDNLPRFQLPGGPANVQTLYKRREAKCHKLFAAMERPTHKLHYLLPKRTK